MSRFLTILGVVLALSTSALAGTHTLGEHIGFVKSSAGTVYLLRGHERVRADDGALVYRQDTVHVGEDGRAGIVFLDGTTLALDSETTVKMSEYSFDPASDDFKFFMYMKEGRTIYKSGSIGRLAPENVTLETPRATIGIRGTRLVLDVRD